MHHARCLLVETLGFAVLRKCDAGRSEAGVGLGEAAPAIGCGSARSARLHRSESRRGV